MKRKGILFLWLVFWGWQGFAYPLRPNLDITPSSVCTIEHPDFSEYRYKEKIAYCKRSVSTQLKNYIYQIYNIPSSCRSEFTIDHFIPLSIGGDNSIENLWPEHKSIKHSRPNLEWDVYQDLKEGRILQRQAIAIIYHEKTTYNEKWLARCK